MKDEEARVLLARLKAAFPRIIEQATVDLYLERLRLWDLAPATEAVDQIVENARAWPTIAELKEVYFRTHERHAAYVRQAAPDPVGVPPPPEVLELMGRIGRDVDAGPDPRTLPSAGHGRCDDCKREGLLFRFGRLALCFDDASSRLRAAAGIDSEVPPAADRSLDTSVPSAGGTPSESQGNAETAAGHGRSPDLSARASFAPEESPES